VTATNSLGNIFYVQSVLETLIHAERDLRRIIQDGRNSSGRTDVFEAQSFLRQAITSLLKTITSNRK
jgi:hypothetical protein